MGTGAGKEKIKGTKSGVKRGKAYSESERKKPQLRKEIKKEGETSLKLVTKKDQTESPQEAASKQNWKEEIKQMLLGMKAELLRDVSKSVRIESDHLRFDIGDFYDHATSDRDRELYLTFTDRERDKLRLIDEALEKIKSRTFGICEECGEEIGEDRLMAMPFANLCLSCKMDLERKERGNV